MWAAVTESTNTTLHTGVACSLLASVLFAANYYLATHLAPLGGQGIYGWRILLTAPLLGFFIVASGRRSDIAQIWQRVVTQVWL